MTELAVLSYYIIHIYSFYFPLKIPIYDYFCYLLLLSLLLLFLVETALPGFTSDKEILVTYKGQKGSVDWRECGLELQFEKDQSGDGSNCPIHISIGSGAYSRYPNRVQPLSKVYRIHSHKKLNTSVTIRIQHNEKDDMENLCLITCTEDQPPYSYNILHNATFTSEYGEVVVSRFSLYSIARLITKYRVRGALSLLEKTYEASIYISSAPNALYNIYVSILKNCPIFKNCMENHIKYRYDDKEVKLLESRVVRFDEEDKNVTTKIVCNTNSSADVFMNEVGCYSLRKIDISSFVDSCPPHLKFQLNYTPGCSATVQFTLKGLEPPNEFVLYHTQLPGKNLLNVCMCVYMYVCMYVCVYACMCMYVCMYVWLHVCMYICMYVSVCVCVYVYTFT